MTVISNRGQLLHTWNLIFIHINGESRYCLKILLLLTRLSPFISFRFESIKRKVLWHFSSKSRKYSGTSTANLERLKKKNKTTTTHVMYIKRNMERGSTKSLKQKKKSLLLHRKQQITDDIMKHKTFTIFFLHSSLKRLIFKLSLKYLILTTKC